jgi:hypothetical protein
VQFNRAHQIVDIYTAARTTTATLFLFFFVSITLKEE